MVAMVMTASNQNVHTDIDLNVGALANPATPDTSPRGIKRSHSGDTYGDLQDGDNLGDDGTCFVDPIEVLATCFR